MTVSSKMIVRDGVLFVSVSGTRPDLDADAFDDANERLHLISQACRRDRVTRILYDYKVEGKGTSTVTYKMFSNFDRFGFDVSTRLAFVVTDAFAGRVLTLGSEVAQAAGWQIQLFEESESALHWLRGETGQA